MARTNNLTNFLTDVASAIKTKTGDSSLIPASQFDTKIANISTGHLDNTEYQEANDDLDDILEGSTPTKIYPPDWSEIGYSETPQNILDDFNYSKDIKDNWDSSVTNLSNKFSSDTQLVYMPLVDTSNATNINSMFNSCSNLKIVPLLNISNVTDMRYAFQSCGKLEIIPVLNTSSVTKFTNAFSNCTNLTETSLNNLLQMLINATSYTDIKTLKFIGLKSAQATTCTELSNWAIAQTAGWTTGY